MCCGLTSTSGRGKPRCTCRVDNTRRLAFLFPPLPFQPRLPPEAQCRRVFFNLRASNPHSTHGFWLWE